MEMIASTVTLQIVQLYTWKTVAGILAVVVAAPAVVKLVEVAYDWWYWNGRK